MSEDMARALGSEGVTTITIAGKQCTARPLSLAELTVVERDCVKRYRRSYIETFVDNADLLPKDQSLQMISKATDKAARWDIDDLPQKFAYDPDRLKLNKEVRQWLAKHFDLDGQEVEDDKLLRFCASALDQGLLSPDAYKGMVGEDPSRLKVGYANWWITGCMDGMVSLLWVCFRHNGVTREQVLEELENNPALLTEMSSEISSLTAPQLGNG